MELFLAFAPSNETREKLMGSIAEAAQYGHGLAHRWETLHTTLAYLGELPEEKLADVVGAVKEVCGRHAALKMSGEGRIWLSPDTSVYNARGLLYLWEKTPEIQSVYDDISAQLAARGFWHDDHGGYMPHSTLYMTYYPADAEEKVPAAPVCADCFKQIIVYQVTTIDGHVAYYPLYAGELGE